MYEFKTYTKGSPQNKVIILGLCHNRGGDPDGRMGLLWDKLANQKNFISYSGGALYLQFSLLPCFPPSHTHLLTPADNLELDHG